MRDAGHRAVLLLETHAALTTRLGVFHAFADDPDVAAVIVPSEYNRAHLNKDGRRRAPIHVVPNGVDQDRFRPRSPEELRRRFDTLVDNPVVLWIGRLEDEKNPRGFLRLAMGLARSHHDLRFVCIGDAPHEPESYARFEAEILAGMRDRFTFIRTVPNAEMPDYYSLAGVTGGFLVSTSRFESVPMTFLEAMASGCPVVSTDVGGVREILEEDVTGLLFRVDDPDDAIRACRRLIGPGASALRTELVAKAATYVARNHSLEVSGARFANVVDAIGAASGQ
jgi:glycosyltransferase involved in cell wall biosynthesis